MKRLLVVANRDPFDQKTWSGTPLAIIDRLKDSCEHISGISIFKYSRIYGKWLEQWGKHFYNRYSGRGLFFQRPLRKNIMKNARAMNADTVLCISEHAWLGDSTLKKYIYIDAVLEPLLQYEPHREQKEKRLFSRVYQLYKKRDIKSLKEANQIFTMNDWTAEYLVEGYGIDKSKIHSVGFGINLNPMTEMKSYDNNLLLIVLRKGNERLKGMFLVIDAFRVLKKKHTKLKLAIVGSDGDGEIKDDGITFYYNKSREITKELFKKSTLYVMPALGEPNGITYLEALANKTPTVALNRLAYPQFCGYGKYGFICEHEDAEELAGIIDDALSDKDRLRRMGEEGQQYVMENFTWEKTVENMKKFMD